MISRWLFCLSILGLFAACGEPSAPPTPVASLHVSRDTATLVPGATLSLVASPADAQGKPLSRSITWTSSNTAVATVAGGFVSAVGTGTATITATAMSVSAQTQVVVKPGGLLGPAGATLNLLDGRVVLVVPAGAISSPTQIVVDAVTPSPTAPRLVAGTAFAIEAGTVSAQPFLLSLTYDQSALKTGAPSSGLKIYSLTNGKWDRVAGSVANVAGRTVTASIKGFGVFAIFEQAPATAQIAAGNDQTAVVGTSVPTKPAVRVVDTEGFGVPGISIAFAVTAGNGAATGTTVTTDTTGTAVVGDWTLGSLVGANKLAATATGAAGGPLEFQATGIAGAPTNFRFVQGPPSAAQNRVAFSPATTIQLSDKFGNAAPVAGIAIVASLSSGSGTLGGTVTRTTNASGVATFDDLVFSGATGSKTIALNSGSLTGLTSLLSISAGAPQTVTVNSGGNQTTLAGSPVSTAPSAKVSDADGNPVVGVPVNFAVTTGGGSVTGPDANTDAGGIAKVGSWTLGTVAGGNTLTASVASISSKAVFHATGTAGSAGRLAFQTAPSPVPQNRISFPVQPVIQVQDQLGNAVSQGGLQVTASLVSGGGQLLGDVTVTTNSSGIATFTNLSLVGIAGPRTLTFSAADISTVSTNVSLTAGTPVAFTINGGNNQAAAAGSAVLTPPSVIVKDADGNPVSGVAVAFQPQTNSGAVTGGTPTSDNLGVATVGSWILSNTAGTNTMNATTTAVAGVTLQFTATGNAGAAASIAVYQGSGQTAIAGRGVRADIYFRVLDAFGNGVPFATVNFVVSSGGSLTSANATSSSNGLVLLPAWTLGPGVGSQSITASVTGATIPSAVVTATAVKTRIVTFGDSNTDIGFQGTSSTIRAVSYVSVWSTRPAASAANSSLQLAGKIESVWSSSYSPAIEAVNHGISETVSGSPRTTRGAPGARTVAGGFSRFDAEVLGLGYPWLGGEPAGQDYPGQLTRSRAYIPTENDFAYISIGTNDASYLISTIETVANLRWMVERWIREGLPANHLFLTTLSPSTPSASGILPEINRNIRGLATEKGINLIDIAAYTSDNDGLTWKGSSFHVGDSLHYSESVRDWIAGQLVAKMAAVTVPLYGN